MLRIVQKTSESYFSNNNLGFQTQAQAFLLLSYGIKTKLLTDITYYSNTVAAKGPYGHRVEQPPCKKNNKIKSSQRLRPILKDEEF